MDATAMAITAGVLLFTLFMWFLVTYMGKRTTWMLILTAAVTIAALLVIANACGYIEIWPILTPEAAVTP